jgi:hypothetical protein
MRKSCSIVSSGGGNYHILWFGSLATQIKRSYSAGRLSRCDHHSDGCCARIYNVDDDFGWHYWIVLVHLGPKVVELRLVTRKREIWVEQRVLSKLLLDSNAEGVGACDERCISKSSRLKVWWRYTRPHAGYLEHSFETWLLHTWHRWLQLSVCFVRLSFALLVKITRFLFALKH